MPRPNWRKRPNSHTTISEHFYSSTVYRSTAQHVCDLEFSVIKRFLDVSCRSFDGSMPSVASGNFKDMITNSRDTSKLLYTWLQYCFTLTSHMNILICATTCLTYSANFLSNISFMFSFGIIKKKICLPCRRRPPCRLLLSETYILYK